MHTPWAIFHCVCQFAYVVTRWLCTLHKYILAHHHQNCECDSRFCEHGVETLNLTSAIDSGTFERATIAATVFCWESFRGILRTKSRWSPLGFQRYRNQSEKLNRPFLLDLQRFRAENAGGIFWPGIFWGPKRKGIPLSTSTCMRLMSGPHSFHVHAHECFLSPVLLLDSWNLCHSACQLDALFSFVGEKCMHLYVEFGPPRRELPKSKKFLKVKNIKEEEYWMKSGAWRGVFSLHNTSKIYEELFQIGLSVLPLNFLTAT